jgi:PIN domain nuclease of toxin-antitoxin system
MFDSIIAAFDWAATPWSTASEEVKAAIISTFGTVLLAVIAVWQIGRQAKHSIQQNRLNEAQKLKLQIYQVALQSFNNYSTAELEYSSFLRNIQMDLDHYKIQQSLRLKPKPPRARVRKLNELNLALTVRTMELIRLVEQWHIIDSRLYLFQEALNAANHDIGKAQQSFFQAAMRVLPAPQLDATDDNDIFPWSPPGAEQEKTFLQLLHDLMDKIDTAANYVTDFQAELQSLLLGELFEHRVRIRRPLDPSKFVVRLDDYDRLMDYFDKESAWGKYRTRLHNETLAQLARK